MVPRRCRRPLRLTTMVRQIIRLRRAVTLRRTISPKRMRALTRAQAPNPKIRKITTRQTPAQTPPPRQTMPLRTTPPHTRKKPISPKRILRMTEKALQTKLARKRPSSQRIPAARTKRGAVICLHQWPHRMRGKRRALSRKRQPFILRLTAHIRIPTGLICMRIKVIVV